MNPALFVDVAFDSQENWNAFQLEHGISHQTTYNRLLARDHVPVYFPTMDFPREDNETYLLDHYLVHVSNARILGITNVPDLATVDLSDPEQYREWLVIHAEVHHNENQALGIL